MRFTGQRGREAVEAIAARVASHLACQPSDVFIASTGVIGVPLPIDKAEAGLTAAFAAPSCSWEEATNTIGTTDTFPKAAQTQAIVGGKPVTLVGIIKGSGMIAPDMATMLGFIFTDAAVAPAFLQTMLTAANRETFSCITVDSDTSTSDTVLAFATSQEDPLTSYDDPGADAFQAALTDLCRRLAHLVVRDGEGATKFITVAVTGAESDRSAHRVAMSIANSRSSKPQSAVKTPTGAAWSWRWEKPANPPIATRCRSVSAGFRSPRKASSSKVTVKPPSPRT